jgi:hypothetical protein
MKTVYSAANISLVSIFRDILAEHGINCMVRNEFLSAGSGELPPIECWPQLCVEDDDFDAARRIVEEALAAEPMPPWRCPCGEELEGQFSECWNCGTARPLPETQTDTP